MNVSLRFLWMLTFCIFSWNLTAATSTPTLAPYLQLLAENPDVLGPKGNWKEGEIEILTDSAEVAAAEKATGRTVGLIVKDRYWVWLNDAVRFPSGKEGVYGRILWVQSLAGPAGAAVVCLLPDGKIVLNCNYRHATRSWEIELPRGCTNPGETAADTAKREALEETGMIVDSLICLGEVACDSGMTNSVIPVFCAKVVAQEKTAQEDSEAIEAILSLTIPQILQGVKDGEMNIAIRGKERKVKVRDPFLAYALLHLMTQQPHVFEATSQ